MPSLKEDIALAANLLGKDTRMCELMELKTQSDKAARIVPMRQQPNEASDKPLVNVYSNFLENLGRNVTSNRLSVDVYIPLTTQKKSGLSYDITRRIKEILDKQPIGRGLSWYSTDPDRRSLTGWHKATVMFTFQSTQY